MSASVMALFGFAFTFILYSLTTDVFHNAASQWLAQCRDSVPTIFLATALKYFVAIECKKYKILFAIDCKIKYV